MKILYLTDRYGRHNMGTKPSIFRELKRLLPDAECQGIHSLRKNVIDGPNLLETIRSGGFKWVWIAHTWVKLEGCTLEDIHAAGARVLGFGFSDPYGWSPVRLSIYDAYATNHFGTYDQLQESSPIPVTTIITAGDTTFHQDQGAERDIDILIYGLGVHHRFQPPTYRIELVQALLEEFADKKVQVYGTQWGDTPVGGYIKGQAFLGVINRAKVCLDLQQPHAPLAHRMFEATMCGTPTITRRRSETDRVFGEWEGILYYDALDDLIDCIRNLLGDPVGWQQRSEEVKRYVLQKHDITNRVQPLLDWMAASFPNDLEVQR